MADSVTGGWKDTRWYPAFELPLYVQARASWWGEPAAGRWRQRDRAVRFRLGEWTVQLDSGRHGVTAGWSRREEFQNAIVGGFVGRVDGDWQMLLLTKTRIVRRGIEP